MADMASRLSRHVHWSLSLGEDDLRAIDTAARSLVATLKISVRLPDGVEMELSDFEALLRLPNSENEAVESIQWTGQSDIAFGLVKIGSDGFLGSRNIMWEFSGKDVGPLREASKKLETTLREARPNYWLFAERDPVGWVSILLLACVPVMALLVYRRPSPLPRDLVDIPVRVTAGLAVASLVAGGVLIIMSDRVVHRIWQWLFPLVSFHIGYGARRHRRRSFVRVGILLALLLGIISSVLATLITS